VKVRSGFVSNSSSSSFIIGVKGEGSLDDKLAVMKHEIPSNNPMSGLLNPLIDDILSTVRQCSEKVELEDWLDTYDFSSIEEARESWGKDVIDLFEKGMSVYEGAFSDEGTSGAETLLCYTSLNFKSDDFVMIHEGGY